MISNNFRQILQRAQQFFKSGSILSRLILINIAVWLFVTLVSLIMWLFQVSPEGHSLSSGLIRYLAVPADLLILVKRPWTLFTYMFLHERFWHIFFNMYMLYFGGRIFLQYLTERHLLRVYIIGGLAGALLYIFSYNVFPVFSNDIAGSAALGASASVLAILIAIATFVPNYTVNLMFFGQVKLKYLALVFIGIDLISIQSGNAGGHIAHIGGALAGYLYIIAGKKPSAKTYKNPFAQTNKKNKKSPFQNIFKIPKKRPFKDVQKNKKPLSDEEYNIRRSEKQKKINAILDKISKSGYDSLSKEEKEILFKQSKQ